MSDRIKVTIAYAALVLIWGTTWLAIKWGLAYMPPLQGVGFRYLIAGVAVLLLARLAKAPWPRGAAAWKVVIVTAFALFGLNYVLIYYSEQIITSGLTAVLFGTTPFWIMLFAYMMAGEQLTPRKVLGSLLALGGVATVSLSGSEHGTLMGIVEVLAAAVFAAFGNVYVKRHQQASEPLVVIPPAMLISGIVFSALGWLIEPHDPRAFALPSLLALGYLGIFGSAVGFLLNYALLRRLPATTVGLANLIIRVVAVLVGIAAAGERFTLHDLLGAALVFVGIVLALTGGMQRRPAYVPGVR